MNDTVFEGEFAAPAKINLALHVVGRRADGYHLLESLAVFADRIGDRLTIEPASADRLIVDGPFAEGVPTDDRNIVLQALSLARHEAASLGLIIPPLLVRLTKALPHGAGIGGGSSDAAALLNRLSAHAPGLAETLRARASELGADVPMCMMGRPLVARGIGEVLEPVEIGHMPTLVLVNPRIPVSTPAVFKALISRENAPLPPLPDAGFEASGTLTAWLSQTRNDLQKTASAIEPAIGDAVGQLSATGADFVRMSGSGSTVFALYEDPGRARDSAEALTNAHPNWWIVTA